MKINIESIFVERSSNSCVRIGIIQKGGEYEKYPTFFCISNKEWKYIRLCLLGESDFYPYWDDCSNLLKFTPQGIHAAYLGNKMDDFFTFPGNELVEYIDYSFQDKFLGDGWRLDKEYISEKEYDISKWQEEYGPNVIVKIDDVVKERMLKDIQSSLLKTPGKNLIDALVRWAENYSSGNLISVNITFDHAFSAERNLEIPTSYYWWIWDEEQQVRIVNGGYIAHEYDGQYEYSMHT